MYVWYLKCGYLNFPYVYPICPAYASAKLGLSVGKPDAAADAAEMTAVAAAGTGAGV